MDIIRNIVKAFNPPENKMDGWLNVRGNRVRLRFYNNGRWIPIGENYTETYFYEDLKQLIESEELIPGGLYIIKNFTTTTVQPETQSAGNIFDIVVRASDFNKLEEEAYAIPSVDSNYFDNSNLFAWSLRYSFYNDTNRFYWADPEGQGVIYYMKDEYGNEAPYDFKNIQFLNNNKYYYTFSYENGNTLKDLLQLNSKKVVNNIIESYFDDSIGKYKLPKVLFISNNSNNKIINNYIGDNSTNITLYNSNINIKIRNSKNIQYSGEDSSFNRCSNIISSNKTSYNTNNTFTDSRNCTFIYTQTSEFTSCNNIELKATNSVGNVFTKCGGLIFNGEAARNVFYKCSDINVTTCYDNHFEFIEYINDTIEPQSISHSCLYKIYKLNIKGSCNSINCKKISILTIDNSCYDSTIENVQCARLYTNQTVSNTSPMRKLCITNVGGKDNNNIKDIYIDVVNQNYTINIKSIDDITKYI